MKETKVHTSFFFERIREERTNTKAIGILGKGTSFVANGYDGRWNHACSCWREGCILQTTISQLGAICHQPRKEFVVIQCYC